MAGDATFSRDKEASELGLWRKRGEKRREEEEGSGRGKQKRRRRRDYPHHHFPTAEVSRGGAYSSSQVSYSEFSKCRERGAAEKGSVGKRRKQGERGSCLGKKVRERRREKAKGGSNSLGSKEEDQGVDRLQNGIAPVAGIPLEQCLYTGNFSCSVYFTA